MPTSTTKLKISQIQKDSVQTRAAPNSTAVSEYAEVIKDLPPIDVFFDGKHYWNADGFHRIEAHELRGLKEISCKIHKGSKLDALRFSLGSNCEHGVRLTNDDKRRKVNLALKHFSDLSDCAIAEMCHVSDTFVGNIRNLLKAQAPTVGPSISKSPNKIEKRTGLDGKSYSVPLRPKSSLPPRPKALDKVKDETGLEVPEELIAFWESAKFDINDLLSNISKVKNIVKTESENNNVLFRGINWTDTISKLEQVYVDIKNVKPYAVCFDCNGIPGQGCRSCNGRGYISKFFYDNALPDEKKKLREKALKPK
jgi:uncharacterized ParB-like nuclease family protein